MKYFFLGIFFLVNFSWAGECILDSASQATQLKNEITTLIKKSFVEPTPLNSLSLDVSVVTKTLDFAEFKISGKGSATDLMDGNKIKNFTIIPFHLQATLKEQERTNLLGTPYEPICALSYQQYIDPSYDGVLEDRIFLEISVEKVKERVRLPLTFEKKIN